MWSACTMLYRLPQDTVWHTCSSIWISQANWSIVLIIYILSWHKQASTSYLFAREVSKLPIYKCLSTSITHRSPNIAKSRYPKSSSYQKMHHPNDSVTASYIRWYDVRQTVPLTANTSLTHTSYSWFPHRMTSLLFTVLLFKIILRLWLNWSKKEEPMWRQLPR